MTISLPAVVLLAVIVVLLIKKSDLKMGHAIVAILLGFYLRGTSLAPGIGQLAQSFAHLISGMRL